MRGAGDIVYLNFREPLDTVPNKIPTDKSGAYGLNSEVAQKRAEQPGPESCDQQHKVYLEASNQWRSPGVRAGYNPD